jgi:hypothetical protein
MWKSATTKEPTRKRGKVYLKSLGHPSTLAAAMTTYDPDST